MTRSTFNLDDKTIRSYATEAALIKKLDATGLADNTDYRYIICRTPSGRWTAIFHGWRDGGFPLPVHHGFVIVN